MFISNFESRSFFPTPETIEAVWRMATMVPGNDPASIRKDSCGAWIMRTHYGNRSSSFGWEIHHVIPRARGGVDQIWNFQPLHWQNNVAKGDGPLVCAARAQGSINVRW